MEEGDVREKLGAVFALDERFRLTLLQIEKSNQLEAGKKSPDGRYPYQDEKSEIESWILAHDCGRTGDEQS